MKSVFKLMHEHEISEIETSIKCIGIYSSEEKAKEAMERSKKLPGFSKYPEGFVIDEYELDKDNWVEGFVTMRLSSNDNSDL